MIPAMAQLTVPGARARGTRTMRSERVVPLRQSIPRGYLTLRKDVPVYLTEMTDTTTTPKVDDVPAPQDAGETAAGKGGEAR